MYVEYISSCRREKASDPRFLQKAFMAGLCLQYERMSLSAFMIGRNAEWFGESMLL